VITGSKGGAAGLQAGCRARDAVLSVREWADPVIAISEEGEEQETLWLLL